MVVFAIGTVASTLASLMTFFSTMATSLHLEVIKVGNLFIGAVTFNVECFSTIIT
jgi:hypothetical protein